MQRIVHSKFFIVLCLSILILNFLFVVPSYAVEDTGSSFSVKQQEFLKEKFLETDMEYPYCMAYVKNGEIYLNLFKTEDKFYIHSKTGVKSTNVLEVHRLYLNLGTGAVTSTEDFTAQIFDWVSSIDSTNGAVINAGKLAFWGNCSVYTDNSYNTLFFQKAPVVCLMRPLEITQIPEIIRKMLTILVPIGLLIFGMFCLVYLLGSHKWLIR